MASAVHSARSSSRTAVLIGIAAGGSVIAVYLVTGLLFGGWSLSEFQSDLTLGSAVHATLFGAIVVASVAIPVAFSLHYRLVSPLGFLILLPSGWYAYGLVSGILTAETVFGFTMYLFLFAPFFIGLVIVIGGIEYYARERGSLS